MNTRHTLRLSIRIDLPNGGRFGPGKAALLDAIERLGSLNRAAPDLGMSYPRARKLIEELNKDFAAPLVLAVQGGADGGGSRLTPLGQELLRAYRELCETAEARNLELLDAFARRARQD